MLLQQLLQILTAPPQSNPIKTTQKKYTDSDDDPRTPRTRTGEQDCSKKQVNFRNLTDCPYYLAASGDVGGLIIGIGDIALAGEKHLSVAVSASMAAGRTGGVKLLAVERRRRRRRRREDVIAFDFYRVYLLFRLAVKSIAEDSSAIEHTRCPKTAASSGGFSAWLDSFLPSS